MLDEVEREEHGLHARILDSCSEFNRVRMRCVGVQADESCVISRKGMGDLRPEPAGGPRDQHNPTIHVRPPFNDFESTNSILEY